MSINPEQIPDQIAVVVQSDWWSKINWAQVVGFVVSTLALITGNRFDVEPAIQAYVVLMVQGMAGLVTVYFRRHTVSVTPTAAKALLQQQRPTGSSSHAV